VKVADGYGSRDDGGYGSQGRSAGMKMGGYLFAQPGNAVTQANLLCDRVEAARLTDLAPALDLESPFQPNGQAAQFAIAFLLQVAARGHRPCLYANNAMLSAVLAAVRAAVPGVVVWAARYGANPTVAYDVWQHSDAGSVPGVHGAVDLSVTDNLAALLNASVTFGGVSATEEPEMLVPAGTNEHAELFVKGKTEWYLLSAFGDHVTVHQTVYNGPTPATSGPAYLSGGNNTDWTFDPNRPGPIPIPSGAVQLTIRYTSSHPFTLAAA